MSVLHSVVLVDDDVLVIAGGQRHRADEQAHLVVRVQRLPQLARVFGGVILVQRHPDGLAGKAGDGAAVFLVGGDEVCLARHRLREVKGLALHTAGVAVAALEDAQLVRAAPVVHHAGDAGGVVGGVILKGAGGQRGLKAVAGEHKNLYHLTEIQALIYNTWALALHQF